MQNSFRLLCGPARSARAAAAEAVFIKHWGRAILLTPTQADAMQRRERLLASAGREGLWGLRIAPFTRFVETLLQAQGLPLRRLGHFERRLLLQRCVADLVGEHDLGPLAAAAEAPGAIRHLLQTITQLKQAAVEPEDFARLTQQQGGNRALDAALSSVYTAYQDALKARQAYDVPGLYWEAEVVCQAGCPALLDGVQALVLDGFDDFTPSEFRLIKALAPHCAQVVVGLNCDLDPERRDCFARPLAAMEQVEQAFQFSAERFDAPAASSYSAFAARHVFWRDLPPRPEKLKQNLRIVQCQDPRAEIEWIGRRVKALILDEQAPPEKIAVVFRSIAEAAPRLQQVFAEYGVPLRLAHEQPLVQSSAGRFLLRHCQAWQGWQREEVLEVLQSPWLRPLLGDVRHADAFAHEARRARIIGGRQEWTQRLERRTADAARDLLDAVRKLGARLDAMPKEDGVAQWCRHWDALLTELNFEKTAAGMPAAIQHAEIEAVAALRSLLQQLAASGDNSQVLTRSAFMSLLASSLQEASYAAAPPGAGVVAMDPTQLRNLRFDHVFFGGLIEGAVPAPPGRSAIYSDFDIERLREAGVPLEGWREHGARERLLFHHVLAAADKSLTLSHSIYKEGGREAEPSPFLCEVRDLFEVGEVVERAPMADDFLPKPERIASLRDLRNWAFAHPHHLAQWRAHLQPEALGAEIEQERQSARPFGRFDGVIADPRLQAELAERFASDYAFSASATEQYITCPFSFFMRTVLKVSEDEAPDAALSPAEEGTLLHTLLQELHSRHAGQPLGELPVEELLLDLPGLVRDVFSRRADLVATLPAGLRRVEEQRFQRTVELYLQNLREAPGGQWRPTYFELSFGGRQDGGDPRSLAEPIPLETPAGRIMLRGRIDRLDEDGEELRLIDYKSGKPPSKKEGADGKKVQLPLYVLAIEQWLGRTAAAAAYVDRCGKETAIFKNAKEKKACLDAAREALGKAASGVRAGYFAPDAKQACHACAGCHACRHTEARAERKKEAAEVGEGTYQ